MLHMTSVAVLGHNIVRRSGELAAPRSRCLIVVKLLASLDSGEIRSSQCTCRAHALSFCRLHSCSGEIVIPMKLSCLLRPCTFVLTSLKQVMPMCVPAFSFVRLFLDWSVCNTMASAKGADSFALMPRYHITLLHNKRIHLAPVLMRMITLLSGCSKSEKHAAPMLDVLMCMARTIKSLPIGDEY